MCICICIYIYIYTLYICIYSNKALRYLSGQSLASRNGSKSSRSVHMMFGFDYNLANHKLNTTIVCVFK